MASPHPPLFSMRRMFARLLLTQYVQSTFYAMHTGWPSYFPTGDPFVNDGPITSCRQKLPKTTATRRRADRPPPFDSA
jgi:hypothetical protein